MTSGTLVFLFVALWVAGAEDPPAAPVISYETFGEITVDGALTRHDIVIEKGKVRKREKGPSKDEKAKYRHTPLTPREAIPWDCKVLVIGTGMHGSLPVVDEFLQEAERRGVTLIIKKTGAAVKYFLDHYDSDTNAIFHITC